MISTDFYVAYYFHSYFLHFINVPSIAMLMWNWLEPYQFAALLTTPLWCFLNFCCNLTAPVWQHSILPRVFFVKPSLCPRRALSDSRTDKKKFREAYKWTKSGIFLWGNEFEWGGGAWIKKNSQTSFKVRHHRSEDQWRLWIFFPQVPWEWNSNVWL